MCFYTDWFWSQRCRHVCDVYGSKTVARRSGAIELCALESATAFGSYIQAQRDLTSYLDWTGGAT
jgi:hypothetical protein